MTTEVLESSRPVKPPNRAAHLLRRAIPRFLALLAAAAVGWVAQAHFTPKPDPWGILDVVNVDLAPAPGGLVQIDMTFVNYGAKPYRLLSLKLDGHQVHVPRTLVGSDSAVTLSPTLECKRAGQRNRAHQVIVTFAGERGSKSEMGYMAPRTWAEHGGRG